MTLNKQLDLWPESTGEDKDKRPGSENLREEAAGHQAEETAKEEEKKLKPQAEDNYTKFKPDADAMLKRMRGVSDPSPEEIARKQTEYAKRVYPDQPIESVDKAAEHAEIEKIRANLKTMLNSAPSEPDDKKEDPWSDINPPIMKRFIKAHRKY